MILGIQFWSVKCTIATVRYGRISRISIPSHQAFSSSDASGKRLQWLNYSYENKPLQNAFKHNQHYIYLFKLYSISIILLLKNNLSEDIKLIKTNISVGLFILSRWFVESQTKILVLINFTSLVIFNYLPPCLSFWLSFLLLKFMPVIIF